MLVARTAEELADRVRPGCVLVPTMGALHAGHAELIGLAREHAQRAGLEVVASVFVNPAQFNQRLDFDRYPRDLETDARQAHAAGADAVYAPAVSEVYPAGVPSGEMALPGLASGKGLEDEGRPGHFEGVVRVLHRLYELTRCGAAVFGEKDWQQLLLACETAPVGVEILPAPIVRDPDGLAMSSRNVHLGADARRRALAIPRAIEAAHASPTVGQAEAAMREVLLTEGLEISYATVRDAESLERLPDARTDRPGARVLVTAIVDGVRLLDNGPWAG